MAYVLVLAVGWQGIKSPTYNLFKQLLIMAPKKTRSPRNRTLFCDEAEIKKFSEQLLSISDPLSLSEITNRTINGNALRIMSCFPKTFIDLLVLDPPYNLSKNYNGNLFKEKEKGEYTDWFEALILKLKPLLKSTATAYICSDWKTSILVAPILEKHFHVQNRITWEREKGRGAKSNWKNNTEDIWFCTVSDSFQFNVEAVKLKRRVIAPYRINRKPNDWNEEESGNYRLTHPSNIWTDVTIPFWSMPENTDHPTQKPEKLIAKLILASSQEGDFVFDPFLGSGTTSIVAYKLQRLFCGIEQNLEYCCWIQKRLLMAQSEQTIQGYADGVFWERNSLKVQTQAKTCNSPINGNLPFLDV